MRDLQKLNQQLLNSEFNGGKGIYEAARNQGYSAVQAAALVYKHGFMDGKDTQKEKVIAAYKKLGALTQEQNSRPEANMEGSNKNE